MVNPVPARPAPGHPLVVIVGPCASGKTTLAAHLRNHGFTVHVVGQEHSAIPNLWSRRHPDVVIGLDIDLDTLRRRRGPGWSSALYRTQHERLRDAFAAATVVLDTSSMPEAPVVARVLDVLREVGNSR